MANNNWNNYTEKTATPVDADEVMVRDSADGKNNSPQSTSKMGSFKKLNELPFRNCELAIRCAQQL